MTDTFLTVLSKLIAARMLGDAKSSYIAQLNAAGLNKILEKVMEECGETIIAAKDVQNSGNNKELIHETADLIFHLMIMLAHFKLDLTTIESELATRTGQSGLEEKKQRQSKP